MDVTGQTLRTEVREALGVTPARVERIGSTVVPGIAAKPVIDLMVGSYSENQRLAFAERLAEHAGYEYLRELAGPGREYLRRQTWTPRSNVHVVQPDGELWRNLMFRDFLRSHPEAAIEYATAKRSAAEQTGHLRAYSTAKSDTVGLARPRTIVDTPPGTGRA